VNPYRRLAVTAVVAIVSVGAAVALVANAPREDAEPTRSTTASPGAVWTLDAADVLGAEFATFEDPVGGRFGEVAGGVIDAGDVLVAKAGLINQESKEFEQSELVGFDASTGVVRWSASADEIDNCSSTVMGSIVLCVSGSDVVAIDAASGEVTRYPTGWNVFGVTADGTDIYVVEGEIDGYSVRIHRGTLGDFDARWSLTVDDTWLEPKNRLEIVTIAGGNGVARFSSGTTLFDVETGAIVDNFASPDCVRGRSERGDEVFFVVGRRCSDLFVFRSDLVDSTGRTIATVDAELYQRTSVDALNAPDDPVMFGGTAFDPVSGQELWATDDYNFTSDVAVVDGAVIAPSVPARDLRTGGQLWSADVEPVHALPTAVHGGAAYVVDWQEILAIEPATGARRASVSIEGLLGNTEGRSEQVALQETGGGVLVVNETRLNLLSTRE
jgi:hypothetical protein